MAEWVRGNVVQVKRWTESLFSLIVYAPVAPFTAGQFAKLGLEINGEKIQRAYSYVNAPRNDKLEFYLVTVLDGKLSPPLHALAPGDSLMVTKEAAGFFVLDEIPPCENLWMLATGTALGPYLSILDQGEGLDRFQQIILVHAARFAQDISYLPQMLELQQRYNGKLRVQTVVSREQAPGTLTGRVPALIADGSLEAAVNLELDAENNHVMICANITGNGNSVLCATNPARALPTAAKGITGPKTPSGFASPPPYLLGGAPRFDPTVTKFLERYDNHNPTFSIGEFRALGGPGEPANITRRQ